MNMNDEKQEKVINETGINELEECRIALKESQSKYMILLADFQNYKKRLSQEQTEWSYVAQKTLISDLLEIVDDFERALEQEKRQESDEITALFTGVSMIYQSVLKLLHKHGVSEITQRDEFNPEIHEALMTVDTSEYASGSIVAVLQKGYMFKGKVLRPAKVSIAK